MNKILAITKGCVSKHAMYTVPGTTEQEIRTELKESYPGYLEDSDVLIKSPLAPKYHKDRDMWKVYEKKNASSVFTDDPDFWELAEDMLNT